jgi:catechol 2,3-dioxygenase-like lactoylglutathione lyase family enzyme
VSKTARRRHHVRWLFHSTAMVADYDLAVRNLATVIGLTVLEYSESTEPGIGRRGGMAWAGDNAIEIGQPIGEGAAAQFVERFGGGMHSIALQVENLQATMAHLQQEQVHIAARPRPEMCFSDPRDTGGIFFQWSTFELPVDPRFGAPPPDPLPAARVLAPATHHAFVGALVDDPLAWAGRFAALLGTTVTFEHADAAPGHPMAGVSLGDCTLALFPLPGEDGRALWGRTYERPRTHLLALRVDDLGDATDALHRAGITIAHWEGGLVVLDPAATGGVQIALTGSLLPGDPRREADQR